MKIKDTPSRIVFKVINYILLTLLAFACLAPLWHVLMASFSNPTLLVQKTGILLWPLYDADHPLTLGGYYIVVKNNSLIRGYANTIYYVAVGCFCNVVLSSLAAYCMSRRKAVWMKYLILILTFTMFFNGGMIPTYMVNKALGINNTRWVIIVMGVISVFNIIIIRTAFLSLPESLEESAQLDGAGHLTILFKIILPLTKATIAVIALFYAVGKWNEYLTAAIYLTDRNLFPLQIVLREILIAATSPPGMEGDINTILGDEGNAKKLVEYSTIIFATLPILCIYPFIQKYFVKGVMIGSIKG
jgi:putative aldouronate transport system permease protein